MKKKVTKKIKRALSADALETVAGGLDTPIMPKGVALRDLTTTHVTEATGYKPKGLMIRNAFSNGFGKLKSILGGN